MPEAPRVIHLQSLALTLKPTTGESRQGKSNTDRDVETVHQRVDNAFLW